MHATEFYSLVQEASHADTTDGAKLASEAVLETLGETLTAGEAQDVARQLPGELATHLETADHDGAGYDRGAFVDRVGERLRARESDLEFDSDDAERYTQGVTDALAATLTQGELQDLKAQLSGDIDPLFEGVDLDRETV